MVHFTVLLHLCYTTGSLKKKILLPFFCSQFLCNISKTCLWHCDDLCEFLWTCRIAEVKPPILCTRPSVCLNSLFLQYIPSSGWKRMAVQCSINIKYWNSPTKGKRHVIETLFALWLRKDLRFGRRALGRHLFQVTWTPLLLPAYFPHAPCFFGKNLYPKYFVTAAILFITLILWQAFGGVCFSFFFSPFCSSVDDWFILFNLDKEGSGGGGGKQQIAILTLCCDGMWPGGESEVMLRRKSVFCP